MIAIQKFTGRDSFKKNQRLALSCVFDQGRDLLFVSPTGSGKSLTFQLGGYALDSGFVLVLCPAIALITNHVRLLTPSAAWLMSIHMEYRKRSGWSNL